MKKIVIYVVTIIVSSLLIFAGNLIVSDNNIMFNQSDVVDPIEAKVTDIVKVDEIELDTSGTEGMKMTEITFKAKILKGERKGDVVKVLQTMDEAFGDAQRRVDKGDKVLIFEQEDMEMGGMYQFYEFVRLDAIILLAIVFAAFLILFGRLKGINTIISLVFTCLCVFAVFVPAVLSGRNIYLWSIMTCAFIIITTLILVNGWGRKTACAMIGCFSGVLVSGGLTLIMDKVMRLTGVIDEDSIYLMLMNPEKPIDLKAIIFAAIIIGAVGAVMDVSMSISSSLYEIKEKSHINSVKELILSGIRIGRDIIGTMANTLILAYMGSSLATVLLLVVYNSSLTGLLNREMIIVEILQALVGSLGILAAIPLTSVFCGLLYKHGREQK